MRDKNLAIDLKVMEGKTAYDSEVKNILAYREILSIILKNVVVEFRDMELEDIGKCIEKTEVGKRKVHPGYTNEKIYGKNGENKILGEGEVIFDVIFDVHIPGEDGIVKMIINVEAQRINNPGYELVTRGVYYTAREISSQYGREFVKSDYDSIKKVYSIWICIDTNKDCENAITEYSITEKTIYNHAKVKKEVYDKMCVIMIYLKKDLEKKSEYIIDFLSVLLSEKLKYDRKIDILENNLGVSMTEEAKKETDDMCNLSEYVYDSGVEKGEMIKLIKQISKKIQKDKSLERISDELEEDLEKIRPIYEAANQCAPEYDCDRIYTLLNSR